MRVVGTCKLLDRQKTSLHIVSWSLETKIYQTKPRRPIFDIISRQPLLSSVLLTHNSHATVNRQAHHKPDYLLVLLLLVLHPLQSSHELTYCRVTFLNSLNSPLRHGIVAAEHRRYGNWFIILKYPLNSNFSTFSRPST